MNTWIKKVWSLELRNITRCLFSSSSFIHLSIFFFTDERIVQSSTLVVFVCFPALKVLLSFIFKMNQIVDLVTLNISPDKLILFYQPNDCLFHLHGYLLGVLIKSSIHFLSTLKNDWLFICLTSIEDREEQTTTGQRNVNQLSKYFRASENKRYSEFPIS